MSLQYVPLMASAVNYTRVVIYNWYMNHARFPHLKQPFLDNWNDILASGTHTNTTIQFCSLFGGGTSR